MMTLDLSQVDLFYGKLRLLYGKMTIMDSLEIFEACDLKIGRFSKLNEKMKVYEYLRPMFSKYWSNIIQISK